MLYNATDTARKDLVQLNVNYDKNQTEYIKINDRYNDQATCQMFPSQSRRQKQSHGTAIRIRSGSKKAE